jgi:uncharacterized protein YggE
MTTGYLALEPIMLRLASTACALLALTPVILAPAAMAQEAPQPTLSLSATAQVHIEPEFAAVRSGVIIRAETAEEAVRENSQMMSGVFSTLRRAGIAERDMQTTDLSVRPVYSNRTYENEPERRIIAYEARNTVTARVRDLGDVGEIIDAMVTAGANNIESVRFGAEDTEAAMDEARRMAVARLIEKSELFADAAGLELCGIRRMSESFNQPQFANRVASRSFAEGADTPVAAGELTLSASVNADFCIE